MKRYLFGSIATLVLTIVVGAAPTPDDAVTITIKDPGPGDRVRVSKTEDIKTKTSFVVQGTAQGKDETVVTKTVYVDDIESQAKGAKKPTKLKRLYEKAEKSTDGKASQLPYEGKTILIEKKGDKYVFTESDGTAVTGPLARDLTREFTKDSGTTQDLMPGKPVKPGDSWEVKKEVAMKALGAIDEFDVDADKLKITGKLVKTYKKGTAQFGTIEFTFEIPIKGLNGKTPLTLKEGKMSMQLTADACIDGSEPTASIAGKLKLAIAGMTQGIDLRVESNGTQSEKIELLPKK